MFKKGQKVVKILYGAGVKTATLQKVEKVDKEYVFLKNCSLKYSNSTGKEINPIFPDFWGELVPMED